jgi:hypothetical protein
MKKIVSVVAMAISRTVENVEEEFNIEVFR